MDEKKYDLIIIGGGASGFGAALYAGRFLMKTIVIAESIGGTITLTDDIANYPGFASISGAELAKKIEQHAREYGVDVIENRAESVEKCNDGCFRVSAGGSYFHSKALIFATGTEWKKLNVPGEKELAGKGVHYCGLCDGAFYQGRTVGVVGGSDSAAKESLLLANYAEKVYLFVKGERLRPEPINLKKVSENRKIEVITNISIKEIIGNKFLEKVILNREHNGSREFRLDGLFIDIGRLPLSGLAKGLGVRLNEKGEIMIDRNSGTNIDGVYGAGDVTDTPFKQAVTGVGEGVTAAFSAYHYVNKGEFICVCDEEEASQRP